MAGIDETLSFRPVNIAILTVSDTRTLADDRSGQTLVDRATAAGHTIVDRAILPDDRDRIAAQFSAWIDNPAVNVAISTGGTGLTGRDVTPEAIEPLYDKPIPGFGELFRSLSYQKVGTSTVQSRATAGIARGTYLFALPGSTSACKDAWDDILQYQLDSRYRPCNLIDLVPRLQEQR
ncbi:molybdenum cofactor biosynthesis protein B [Synechococcus sp. PCC 7336]|uniref:molybdenum cofactor biosynthesis protein B n=1 Tax=Synechococcus sp. PCC 7336 TaxID=195250 RepID=UPI00034914E0|nr:molybdenum cofactor biosynthesis protein B [Synechococcus sp. PCC 7336]